MVVARAARRMERRVAAVTTVVDFIYGGGRIDIGDTALSTDWTPAAGEIIVIFLNLRAPDTVPYVLSGLSSSVEQAVSGADFTGTKLYAITGVASGGTVTITPDSTDSSKYWNCYIVGLDEGDFVAADSDALGVFQASVNYGPWTAPGDDGVVLGVEMCSAGDTYDIDTPVGLVDDEHGPSGFLNGGCLGAKAITTSETGNVTGTQTSADIGVVNAAWVVYKTAGGGGPDNDLPLLLPSRWDRKSPVLRR